jgi:ABC-type dipeptide/oligopeptide/nickel transport system permease component
VITIVALQCRDFYRAVITEQIFRVPGIGSLVAIQALTPRW